MACDCELKNWVIGYERDKKLKSSLGLAWVLKRMGANDWYLKIKEKLEKGVSFLWLL